LPPRVLYGKAGSAEKIASRIVFAGGIVASMNAHATDHGGPVDDGKRACAPFAAAMAPFWPAGPLPITTRSYSDALISVL